MKYLLTKISYFVSNHETQLGYFDSEEDVVSWLKANGYKKNENFKDKEVWESKEDYDFDVWIYITYREIYKLA
ncbi:hypothetical protein [Vagococcus fluvialis]|uniref:hypothetical protein n=1 Tax=Vagococcus fluvialis TaxID=2738 RepID=UPI001D0BB7D5|nr:hypothetical protein [Vagococcus fluvialis]UDM72639.1 hypothetical protein K5L00_14725 [Vagococcus fluvialis]UDM78362.1 hypothetical protein K5K98_14930 [Vagococcus fluvialis]UDM83914.1 hypothetical protein K5K96_14750 [Vagococcus fluvialis]